MGLVKKAPLVTLAVVASLCAGGWVVDTALAAGSERKFAESIKHTADLEVTPEVYIGGFPFLLGYASGQIPTVSVFVTDVELPTLGLMRVGTTALSVETTPEQIMAGDFTNASAELVKRILSFDAVALGNQLGITDLDISNPYNVSPSGGHSAEARLRGTIPGTKEPTTVLVDLRINGPHFTIIPTKVVEGDELPEEELLAAFGYTLDTRGLPLKEQANYVYLNGGTISLESEQRTVTLTAADFAP